MRRQLCGGGARAAAATATASSPMLLRRRQQSSHGGGGGGGSGQLHHMLRDYGSSSDSGMASSSSSGGGDSVASEWVARVQRELLQETDALGGMAHKDYYRDPACGYSPQYAPRNYAVGGAVAYTHVDRSGAYSEAQAQRAWLQHDVATLADHAHVVAAARAHATDAATSASALPFSASSVSRHSQLDEATALYADEVLAPSRTIRRIVDADANASQAPQALFEHSGVTSDVVRHRQAVVSRYAAAAATAPPSRVTGTLQSDELLEHATEQHAAVSDDSLDEALRIQHGLRDKERYDFALLQRNARLPFEGYDMARYRAQQQGTPYGAQQLPPVTPPASMAEAQATLRATSLPSREVLVRQAYARNTLRDTPQLGEALTETIARALHAARRTHARDADAARARRFGLGRQGALVQDGGPDKRVLRRHTHDERLVDALHFHSNAYRHTVADEHVNPYQRRATDGGVGHLLRNAFDIHRRDDRLARGLPDLTERHTAHYGVPVQRQLDEYVLRQRNARADRPLDYFRPFPPLRAQRLQRVYADTEGFSLFKARPDVLEWELFVRYRAHHTQRRELACLHGLEPVANETASERDARRRALDELCERTPFDAARYLPAPVPADDDADVDVETLRRWFGVYLLPSPTVVASMMARQGAVNVHLLHLPDPLHTPDTREHVLSARYLNRLALFEGYQHRLGRGFVGDVAGRAPEVALRYAQPPSVLRGFSAAERAMYAEYVRNETDDALARWRRATQRPRRYVVEHGQYGAVVATGPAVAVMDVAHVDSGAVVTIAVRKYAKELEAVLQQLQAAGQQQQQQQRQQGQRGRGAGDDDDDAAVAAAATTTPSLRVDGEEYVVVPHSQRHVTPLSVRLESGEVLAMTDEQYGNYPLEESASVLYNHALDYGVTAYAYNRGNYVETQDVLWEEATTQQREGWSPATHADGLRAGLPVRARRRVGAVVDASTIAALPPSSSSSSTTTAVSHDNNNNKRDDDGDDDAMMRNAVVRHVTGDYQRARIVQYHLQPFYNPEPRTVTVAFASDGCVQEVPLTDVLIWQRNYYGPERTVGDCTRRHNTSGLRRYIDVADPHGVKQRAAREVHFLDKYEHTATAHGSSSGSGGSSGAHGSSLVNTLRTTKQITELDGWTVHDIRRPENYRPLSITHRRDYVRQGYMPRYTPWEWIATQEADQPLILETIRHDDVSRSGSYFALNRFWRYKARPHGYIANFEHEVRDLFQYIDGVTPWTTAQKVRTYWEVREHHPMPQFNRPELAMHRNTLALLPTHLWDADKKTGKVKAVKDSVRGYQTPTPLPKWVEL